MNLGRFLLWSTVGTAAWSTLLTTLGYLLGARFAQVEAWLNPITWAIVIFALGGYLYRLFRTRS